MTDTERCVLAHQTSEAVFNRTATLYADDHVGGDLAYLLEAIIDPSQPSWVDWSDDAGCGCDHRPALYEILQDAFGPPEDGHAVWRFIQL